MPERTADGHHIVVDGRKWRASDPRIPERLQAELVAELMAARRAVRTDGDAARPRVQDAKVALGERGEPWWEEPSAAGLRDRLAAAVRTLLRHRQPESTICPSDIAKVVGGDEWRSRMDDARSVAAELASKRHVRITQRGAEVDLATAKGALRIGRGTDWPG